MFASVLLGVLFARWLYSSAFLHGASSFWQQDNGDITQYLSGFNAFVREPWHWPLLRINSINAPTGTLATFLDAIPLYALLLKVWHHGPATPFSNPYASWIVLCFALQGTGAWWICREARVRSWVALAAMTLLVISFPAFTGRFGHISLMSQWMILFALAIYLRSMRLGRLAPTPWIVLLVCGFYINLYIFAMTAVIFVADVVRHLALRQYRMAVLCTAIVGLILVATMSVTMLPFPPGSGSAEWGFGYYSMNLLAPLDGGKLFKLVQPSMHEGQGEGFNYLGLFLVAMAVHACRLRLRHDHPFKERHAALAVTLVLLTLYALSNQVYFGNTHLYDLALPHFTEKLTSTFRASGRFFWPVGYTIVAFTVISIARYHNARTATAMLTALVALQFWDLQPHHDRVRAKVNEPLVHTIDESAWNAFLGNDIKFLYYYPPFRCGKSTSTTLLPTMSYAVKHNYALSTGYIARAVKSCDNYGAEIATVRSSTVAFVFEKNEFPQLGEVQRLFGGEGAVNCIESRNLFLCKRAATTNQG